ncbi:hypothetical protein BDQ94DRAFT_173144 [Aspergillus welwitschiae]|uniref:Carrier domain-containing protein n=1 Tax=Aspergillus welwitschiae TaxID=1341132 RepID=A0A3F3PTS9_9EURO|nr:hypothetical protein BDQ94DRAFT_173144 [Aspergillus welwitschiae]RDH30162.1 hypothetical protein BDQ94DRAFT_173144 [Aspergillus welwitschiae]
MEDIHQIWSWNANVPEAGETCVHTLITDKALQQPDALAVDAWDGRWTYGELENTSTKLALRLLDSGVGPGTNVVICFEKSKYTPLAMLAVMKAGGASIALDTSQPQTRLQSIINQVDPVVILCSPSKSQLAKSIIAESAVALTIDENSLSEMHFEPDSVARLPDVSLDNNLYVVFTSGSTGTPKGVVVTHLNYSTAILHQQEAHGFKSTSRVYDFASYAFDVSWSNLIHTLTIGACLCIPSEQDRKDNLIESIRSLCATHIDVTPSVARLLPDTLLCKIETLVLGGEKLSAELARHLSSLVTLKNPYGPSECTPTSTIATIRPDDDDSKISSIGRGLGVNTWVVDSENEGILVPIGQVGELLLEGHLLGNGYLNDQTKTTAAFVNDPLFLLNGGDGPGHPGRHGRLYKTGDLVRYEKDGSLTFIGRKDTQVKINGQRVELGDIEHHINRHIPHGTVSVRQIAAEIISPKTGSNAVLAAFLEVDLGVEDTGIAEQLFLKTEKMMSNLRSNIARDVPSYMVPAVFIPLRNFPLSPTGKTDRRQLRAIGESMDLTVLAGFGAAPNEARIPLTLREKQLRRLWGSILRIDENLIALDDNFLQRASNPNAALKLVTAARREGFSLSVANVLKYPRLQDMAQVVETVEQEQAPEIMPFELLSNDINLDLALREAAASCNVQGNQIQDIYPCTPLQEGMMSLSAKREGDYIMQYTLELHHRCDIERLGKAWATVVATTPILRTRIVDITSQGLVQAVLNEQWSNSSIQRRTLSQARDHKHQFGLGMPLGRFEIVTGDSSDFKHYFVWTLHHALYDGWSLQLLLEKLENEYAGKADAQSNSPDFKRFIRYISTRDGEKTHSFWTEQFQDVEAQIFPSLPSVDYQPRSDKLYTHSVEGIQWPKNGITPSTTIRAAYSILISSLTNSPDVVFGSITTGRQAAVDEVEELIAPTIATVPVRVSIDSKDELGEFLQRIQSQAADMIEFEQTGLHQIRHINADAERACQFQTLLVVQPAEGSATAPSDIFTNIADDIRKGDGNSAAELGTYALTMECLLKKDGLDLHMNYCSTVISEHQVRRLSQQFEHVLGQICHLTMIIHRQRTTLESLRQPTTETERQMQRIWAQVLNLNQASIGLDYSFFQLGGDSIAAMEVVTEARKLGLKLAVSDIFRRPKLQDVAKKACDSGLQVYGEDQLMNDSEVQVNGGTEHTKLPDDDKAVAGHETQQVMVWEGMFDKEVYGTIDDVQLEKIGRDFIGWTSMYNGNQMDNVELNEWLDDTIATIRSSGSTANILELGSGSGMILFNLVNGLHSYVGLDPSEKAVDFVCSTVKSIPQLADRVYNIKGTADNINSLGVPISANMVIVNSVVQYFPSQDYLLKVIEDLVQLETVRTIFFGDIRSYALFREFQVTRALHIAGDTATEDEIRQMMANMEQVELELLVDPAFFTSLIDRFPGLVEHVEILPKRLKSTNELSAYRYAAVVHLKDSNQLAQPLQLHDIQKESWINYSGRQLNRQSLLQLVQDSFLRDPSPSSVVAVCNIPYSMTVYERHVIEWLDSGLTAGPDAEDWLSSIRQTSQECSSLSALDLQQIAHQTGWQVEISWSRQFSQRGGLDAIFHRHHSRGDRTSRALFNFPTDHQGRPSQSLSNWPLQRKQQGEEKQITLGDVSTVCKEDLHDIWTWNEVVPDALEACVHDLISDTVRAQPQSPAICAWDGEWSYIELDDLSSRLAHALAPFGVANTVVPICFEKSKWTPVATLAVMKAGAASVTLDASQPLERLRSIISQTDPRVILSSASKQGLGAQLTKAPNLVVDQHSISTMHITAEPLPTVDPSSKLYVVFTSGTTGVPKGVIITHSNFSSAIRHQQKAHGFKSTSRIYDFASYAFDVSWSNFIHALTIGACLCIPSDEDRRDDLAGSLERFGATHVDMTPSAASLLPEKSFKRLETVVLGGEKLSVESAQRWSSLVSLKNPYGPSECTPTATIATVTPTDEYKSSIGRGLGLNTWIVNTVTDSLVPVGGVGELLLEGPLVGAGYLGDDTKTAASFVQDPQFLLQICPQGQARHTRMYKTGDLVHYNPDGSLSFVGRKDAQVKIHGQRVELTEIESHIRRTSKTIQVAVLFTKSGLCANRVVAFVCIQGTGQTQTAADQIRLIDSKYSTLVTAYTESAKSSLSDTLPAYMIPSIWIPLQHVPLSTSGKLDYKALKSWLDSMDAKTFANILTASDGDVKLRKAETELEQVIVEACATILNITASKVNLDRSFIANGGDSISAMRLVAHCRADNVVFSVAKLLKSKTLAALASSSEIKSASNVLGFYEEKSDSFALSPIQKWFFEQGLYKRSNDNFDNQGFYLKVKRPLLTKDIGSAISKVVQHHSMLRARFHRNGDEWTQKTLKPDTNGLYHFGVHHMCLPADIERLALSRHQMIDIEKGPVFSADICHNAFGEQYLILIAHHLVVDLVSWRVILEDIESLLGGSNLQPSLPFQVWNDMQIERAKESSLFDPENVLSTTGINNNLDFWQATAETKNTVEDHLNFCTKIDSSITELILKDANYPFNTEPVDLLLAAVWHAFFKTFPQRDGLTIFIEGHGREPWSSDIDLSRTVGWFTTISPIHVSKSDVHKSVASLVRVVKDARRLLPANGWAYFASRYFNESGKSAFKSHDSIMEITFNYHGQFQQLENEKAMFENVTLSGVCEQGPALPASSLIAVEVSIDRGQVTFDVSANRYINHQDCISDWIKAIPQSLETISNELVSTEISHRTLCDYEFLSLGYTELDRLQESVIPEIEKLNNSTVECIYRCLPTVDGILISQFKDPESYKTVQHFEITSHIDDQIDIEHLSLAWQKVVANQPALRTVFIPGMDKAAAFNQVVLSQYHAELIILHAASDEYTEALEMFKNLTPINYQSFKPPHRVAMCRISPSRVLCQVEMSHAITDGASTSILANDLLQAYNGNSMPMNLTDTACEFARAQLTSSFGEKLSYWKKKLSGMDPCHFPKISGASTQGTGTSVCKIRGSLFSKIQDYCNIVEVTTASLFQTIWALTLAAYTGNDSTCFGYLASGRDLPIAGIDKSIGAFTNMLVCRVNINRETEILQFVQTVHDQVMQDLEHQHCSLASIQHELGINSDNPLFNSILSYQKQDDEPAGDEGLVIKALDGQDPTEYDIVLNIGHATDHIEIVFDYKHACLSSIQAESVLSLMQSTAAALIQHASGDHQTLRSVNMVSTEDISDIWQWNSNVPVTVDECVHHIITRTCHERPQAPAICAWDGDWTYAEVNKLSDKLAHLLVSYGVGPEVVVPLCFEKSKWTPIAMMAVMKAGGASVAMDSTQPEERLRAIVNQVKSPIVLSSFANGQLASRLISELPSPIKVLTISDKELENLNVPSGSQLPHVNPSDTLYVVFTSGSTGLPKGVAVTHSNIASAIKHQRHSLGFTSESRVFDFSSYMFDVVWCNLLQGLSAGSCVCIPSDNERKTDFMAAIVRMRANLVILTPSAIRGLKLDALNSLCNVHFIGEPLHVDTFRSVDESVTISNLYGPTECTTFSTVQTICGRQDQSITIGKGAGLNTWVADIATGTALVPIGSAGELLLEGPLVAAGYRGDAVKTAAAFVYDPPFLLRGSVGHPGRRGRLYKTGDIVRYNSNGTLTFLGRKDSQVKINGQRVEFGDIESHINGALLPDFSEGQALVEFVTPQGSSRPMLVAFVYFGPTVTEGMDEADLLSLAKRTAISLDESLAARIPAFMIPSAYIPLQKIPVTATGKTDRRRLREMAKDVTWDQLISADSHGPDRCQPGTEMEIQLQILWGTVLGVESSLIGAHDNFMRVGGDSVGAIRLASSARELGFTLNVADILKNPKLSDMAKLMIRTEPSQDISIKEFSLLKPGSDFDWAVAETSALCGVDSNQVEDLYPCTPLQEGLLALTTKRPGDYIIRCILELKRSTDVKKFCAAWEAVLESTPILRTRIVDIAEQGLVQAVIKQPAQWTSAEASSLVDFVAADNEKTTGLGMPLVRFGLVQETNKHYFVLTLHHAVYDGWALNLVFEKLENFYAGSSRHESPDFRHFVKHISSLDNDAAAKFWKDQLQGSEAPTFPSLPTATFVPKSEKTILHTVEELQWPKTNVTAFTLVRAALSLLTAAYTNSEDVCFGVTSNGRQVGLPGVERMIGPTIATVPVRVRIDREQRLQAFLTQMQHQSIDMIAFEQFGLQQIRKSSPDAERACNFQSLLIVQPAEETAQWQSDIIARDIGEGADDPMGIQEIGTYALTLECHLGPDSLLIKANFDSNVIDELQVKRFTKQFEHVLRQICCSGSGLVVSDIDTTSRQDMEDIWKWNAVVPQSVNTPVHELISSVARRLPHVQAVCAWDGNWTYRQLDDLSNYVAHHLVGLGVGSQDIVPLLFEKSKWMPIAMLGVMKAGAASVAVDTSQPKDRLRMIIDQANPTVALSSADKLPLVRSLTKAQSFVVNGQGIDCLLKPSLNATLPVVDPSSRLYLVFTSGSTGVPKGVIIRHCNFASAIKHQKEVQGILPTSRVYDFASYAFDVAWANALLTFESGACLCIPSDADRKNDLNGSIARLKPTHADLTPSAALVLSKESLQQLDTLTLGGERLLAEYATKWSQFVTVKNSYGPSECTPTATFTEGIGRGYDLGASIGKPAGLNTWVVDPVTGQSLVPIGGVGELFLEGPLVGAGYLDDAEKTNAAFINDPPFLLRGNVVAQPGRRGTLYKTGDIVRYNSDGSLTFVCRKDTQVKINGQRVELAEIESHIALYTATRQVATLLPSTGLCANKLVAMISLTDVNYDVSEDLAENKIELASSEHDQLINEHIEALQSLLRESLPQYMIPSLWVVLYNLPMTASGKQDNKALKSWLENMDETLFSKINNANDSDIIRKPDTEDERALSQKCSIVLNMPVDKINLDKSFIANGGDSISAMRLASHYRTAGISISVSTLLQSKTLADFAAFSGATAITGVSQEEHTDVPFELSPIQQWFFDQSPFMSQQKHDRFYNQGFYVRLRRTVGINDLESAFLSLVNRHAMLRSRFQHHGGKWKQIILSHSKRALHLNVSQHLSMSEIASLAQERHRQIDIEKGPVFSVDICLLGQQQHLVMIAHHLVTDLVSWRIILDDLETILNGHSLTAALPFQVWSRLQAERAVSSTLKPHNLLSTDGVHNNLKFWKYTHDTPNCLADHRLRSVTIDRETTAVLLGEANKAMNTEPVEILLSAVWDAFFRTFSQRNSLTIFNEGHGREAWSDEIDLSSTVGWFTTLSPINIYRNNATSETDMVRLVKDARRSLPANGWSYFTSRYLNPDGQRAFESHNTVSEVVFNYHGQFQQLESHQALFEDIDLVDVREQGRSISAGSLFNIEVAIEAMQAHFEFSVNQNIAHQSLINKWIDQVQPSLERICLVLLEANPTHTLCDFKFISLDYQRLDDLTSRLLPEIESINQSTVVEIFSCSPIVDGMLLSQIKQPESYKTLQRYEVLSSHDHPICLDTLKIAWQKVISRQPALRTVFITGLDGSTAFYQALLKECSGDVIVVEAKTEEEALKAFSSLPKVDYQQAKPPHRLTLCQTPDDKVFCQIEMSHAITDGASSNILIKDLIDAYSDRLSSTDLVKTTREFASHLLAKPQSQKISYWNTKLKGLEPCRFPSLSSMSREKHECSSEIGVFVEDKMFAQIQDFCSINQVTPASLLKSAWALTLSTYVQNQSVCFGYLASGRDLPIAGMDESVGAYTNIMVCRADLDGQQPGVALVRQLQDQLLQDLSFQHISLASIQHELGLASDQQLFNSIVSFQRSGDDNEQSAEEGKLRFKNIDGLDPTEYDIVLGINQGTRSIEIDLEFSHSCLTSNQAKRILEHLESNIAAILHNEPPALISPQDEQDIWSWNSTVPDMVNICVHDLISKIVFRQPDAPAVCSWDGDFTYAELDNFATRLANSLSKMGIGRGSIVPLCFEKSKWTPVAMLAVMKTGAASVTMDTSQPEERLQSIVAQVDAKLVISSTLKVKLAARLTTAPVLAIDKASMKAMADDTPLAAVDPANSIYIVFTSGSTGTPKGVIITHTNYSSAIKHQQSEHGFKPSSRVFDFASYAFDVSWSNFLHTLTIGACLCIPSDDDRKNDPAGAIDRLRCTHVDMTPSAASVLPASTLAKLDTLVLGGEKLSLEYAQRWSALTSVRNPYGPSECTPTSTITEINSAEISKGKVSIGKGVGLNTWIVDPATAQHLMPIGIPGELLLEGPLVGAGYLGDPVKTASAFIEDPAFLVKGAGPGIPGRRGRLYRTGDLVTYNTDGSLSFVGRRDSQIKINGQRVELGDIESHVSANLVSHGSAQVAVEVVSPQASSNNILVAFVSFDDLNSINPNDEKLLARTKAATEGIREKLATQIPSYMIPSIYIPVTVFPTTATGKTDRHRLREMASSLTLEQLTSINQAQQQSQPPTTPLEVALRELWISVLKLGSRKISTTNNFFELGGDSIGAMRLVGAARDHGLSLSVVDIFKHPKFSEMAALLRSVDKPQSEEPRVFQPTSLLSKDHNKDQILSRLFDFGIDLENVEDILPVTDHQARSIAMTHSASRDLLLYHTLDSKGVPNMRKMRAVCNELVNRYDLLRTLFIAHKDSFLQVVLKAFPVDITVLRIENASLEECTEELRLRDRDDELRYGSLLTKIAILHQIRDNEYRLVVRISHAQHDGMSLMKMWNAFEEMYGDGSDDSFHIPSDTSFQEKSKASFSNYMHAVAGTNREQAKSHWRRLLKGSSMTNLKPHASYALTFGEGPCVARHVPKSIAQGTGFTFHTVLKAAWAYVLAKHLANDDVVFCSLTHGRGLPGTQDVFGDCVNIIPTRVSFTDGWTVRDLLSALNTQQIASMEHENIGTREIVRDCTTWPKWTYAGSIVYHHDFDDGEHIARNRSMHVEQELDLSHGKVDMTDVHITSKPDNNMFRIELDFAHGVVSERDAELLAAKLTESIIVFCNVMDQPLLSPDQIRYLWTTTLLPSEEPLSATPTNEQLMVVSISPTEMQWALESAWRDTFNCRLSPEVKAGKTIFDLGGDLVSASLISAHMERQGYVLSVEDVLGNPTWFSQLTLLTKRSLRDVDV